MSLLTKFDQAKSVLTDFYTASGAEDVSEDVLEKIKSLGVVSDSFVSELNDKDIEAATGLPPAVCKKVARALGAQVAGETDRQIVVVANDPISMALQMTPEQLIDNYDETEPDSPVASRLKVLSGGEPFLVYNDEGQLLKDVSVKNLLALISHYPPRGKVQVGGEFFETQAVGFQPKRWADENPVVENGVLYPDGFSEAGVEWGMVPRDVRSLLRVALDKGEVSGTEMTIWREFAGKNLAEAGRLCPTAFIEWKKLREGEKEPKLRILLQPRRKAKEG